MIFQGEAFELKKENEILILSFDIKSQSSNVVNQKAIADLKQIIPLLQKEKANGLIFKSNKDQFILGADITEFTTLFAQDKETILQWMKEVNGLFNAIENLNYPKVAIVNGFALGGGLEMAMLCDYIVATPKAQLGLPETKLGLIPGFGGTIRLPRIIGTDHAIEAIASAKNFKADEALKIGLVDGVIEDAKIYEATLEILKRANSGQLNWKEKKLIKTSPIKLDKIESMMSFEGAKGFVGAQSLPHYPAPVKAIESIQKGAKLHLEEAILFEHETFIELAKTSVAESLIQVFLADQFLKKQSKKYSASETAPTNAAVLGAGIMGGGISYQSASSGIGVLMKDIKQEQLDLGMNEASKLLIKQIEYKKLTPEKMAKIIATITPTLSYSDFKNTQFVVEAVVENEKVKKSVLADVENAIPEDGILASNTSTISITELATALKRPENFCGMHFFNPVHKMPLVEIIRGKKSSEKTIAKAVSYATKMGKTPIVVNDCPGFLVNRILFPYFNGFIFLVEEGVDFAKVDKVMEKFGWPMGPAYLLDVVGIDTGFHASSIMAQGFPDRMGFTNKTVLEEFYKLGRFGQKNNKGFYEYELDKKGKPQKKLNPAVYDLIKPVVKKSIELTDDDIIMRMMIPMIFESVRCLEDKIVESPIEVDMGLLLGLGFPPFRAGALKYCDKLGIDKIAIEAKKYEYLGKIYEMPKMLQAMQKENKKFY
jgi:3-hydroxyacyl-CoA dehydrogenase/enoyl-CoA hydratase/3-hydroxybutyryl-CoA epimerase/enoyl-CoA isomerase